MSHNHYTLVENLSITMAAIVTGIMAGFFWTYTFNVNPALLNVDGEIYAQVQSLLNQNVRHLMFFIFFFGSGVLIFVACLLNIRHRKDKSFWLLVLAMLVYVLGVIVYTAQVNLPLNYYTESWSMTALPADWQQTRLAWNSANSFRVLASSVSFLLCTLCLCVRSSQ